MGGVEFSEGDTLELLYEAGAEGGREVVFRSLKGGGFKSWRLEKSQFDYFGTLFVEEK